MKKRKTKIKLPYLISGIAVLGLIAGASFIFLNQSDPVAKTKKEEENKVVDKDITIIDPESTTRPYAVMINNNFASLGAQTSLEEAYIVYEIIVEGGITRFLALYKDVDIDRIGSVRSARHYYLDYVLENDAYFVHWGYSDQAKNDISKLGIDNINGLTYEGTYFKRLQNSGLAYEHTGYTSTDMLEKAVDKLNYDKETDANLLLNYSAEPVTYNDGLLDTIKEANNISIKYSNYNTSSYSYDEETKTYVRSINGNEHIDAVTKKQLEVKNIIVYDVDNYTIAGDTSGRQEIENIGNGTGYYISEGQAIEINWSKASASAQTVYTYKNGEEIIVNDGNTFIQIYPTSGTLTIK